MDIQNSIIWIGGKKNILGTGFYVGDNQFLTCAHVIQNARSGLGKTVPVFFEVDGPDGAPTTALVSEIYSEDNQDIALLCVDRVPDNVPALPLASTARGSQGHPFLSFGYATVTNVTGVGAGGEIVALLRQGRLRNHLVQLRSQEPDRGMSGAPVLDTARKVVIGMICQGKSDIKLDQSYRNLNTTFAISVDSILKLFPQLKSNETCPYRSLDYFEEKDAEFFFGREEEVEHLLDHLTRSTRFLAVLGPSGSGKSSLIRAGLIPALKAGSLRASKKWDFIIVRPENDPFAQLASAGLPDPQAGLVASLQKWQTDPAACAKNERLVLVLDQFEELLIACPPELRQNFLAQLAEVLQSPLKITLVIVLRDDFYSRLVQEAGELTQTFEENIVNISPYLQKKELRSMIEGPARKSGLRLEDGLTDVIISDCVQINALAEPDLKIYNTTLPLLEFTLAQLWESRVDGYLTHQAYRDLRKVSGSLVQWADDEYAQLNEKEKKIARRILLNLVYLGDPDQNIPDTRRSCQVSELMELGDADVISDILEEFTHVRLLVERSDAQGRGLVEFVHDTLLYQWAELNQWLSSDRMFLTWRQHLTSQLNERKDPKKGFLSGRDLAIAIDYLHENSADLPPQLIDFIKTSELKERWRRFWVITLLVLIIIATAIAANIFQVQRDLAITAERTAISEAHRRATAQAQAESARATAIAETNLRATAQSLAESAESVAKTAEADAIQQAQIAKLRQLAAQSLNIASTRLDLGLLLSIEASRRAAQSETAIQDNLGEVRGALLNALLIEPRLRQYLPGNPRGIASIAASPDGLLIAAGTVENTILLWDVLSGKPLGPPLSGPNSPVLSLAFSPDGKLLVSGSNDPVFHLWDVSDPRNPRLIAALTNDAPAGSMEFTSDGRMLGVNIGENPTVPPAAEDQTFRACACGVLSMAFSADGQTLALGGGDGHVELWDVPARQRIRTLQYFTPNHTTNPDGGIFSLAFSANGRWLAAGSGSGFIRVWDRQAASDHPARMRYFIGPALARVLFSPDSSTLIYSNGNNSLNLWNLNSSDEYDITRVTTPSRVLSMIFSPDGKRLALGSADNNILLWDFASRQQIGEPLTGHDSEVFSLAFTSGGSGLASLDWNHNIILWDLSRTQRLGQPLLTESSWITSVALSPDGNTAAALLGLEDGQRSIVLWDLTQTPPQPRTLASGLSVQSNLAFSPDGRILAASEAAQVLSWDAASGQTTASLPTGGTDIAFVPGGNTPALLIGGADGLSLWDLNQQKQLQTYLSNGLPLSSIAVSADGSRLAASAGDQQQDGQIFIWDTQTAERQAGPLIGHSGYIASLAFSPDGQILASGGWDKLIILWDTRHGEAIPPNLQGNAGWVNSLAFDPTGGGRVLASGGMDGTVRLWDTRSHQPFAAALPEFNSRINSIAYNPAGSRLIASGEGGTVMLWYAGATGWTELACATAARNLTPAEWQAHFSDPYQPTCPE